MKNLLNLMILRFFLNTVIRKHENIAALGQVTDQRKYKDAAADLEGVARVMKNSPRKLWKIMRELQREIRKMEE